MDDGSVDNPVDVVNAANDNRVRFFRFKENKGRGAARQFALEQAIGEYLCMLDADDWIYPWKLQRQLEVMQGNPDIVILSTGMAIVDSKNDLVRVRMPANKYAGLTLYDPLKKLQQLPIAHGPSMLQMSVAKQTQYDTNFNLSEDQDYLLRILFEHPFAVLSDITYVYSELESVDLTKIIASLRRGQTTLRKYKDKYPVSAKLELIKIQVKEGIYRTAFAVGVGHELIAHRSALPNEQHVREFQIAREQVHRLGLALFAETAYEAMFTNYPKTITD